MKLFNTETLYAGVSRQRAYLMGVAMLLVLVYHLFCWVHNPIGNFNIGFIGVDVFLFLSGFGLCHSFENNTLSTFYFNRLKRIYPLYFVCVCIVYIIQFHNWSFGDFVANLFTAGYYIDGGEHKFDWYIESLFTLYLLFPLFHLLARLKYVALALLFLVVGALMHFVAFDWWYNCLLSRLPIFLYGIIFYHYHRAIYVVLLAGLLLIVPTVTYSCGYLAVSLLTLPLIVVALAVEPIFKGRCKRAIEFMGKYSLEIYLANTFVSQAVEYNVNHLELPKNIKYLLFFVIQIVASWLLIRLNRAIQQCFSKR